MKAVFGKFNLNWITVGLLFAAFVFSAIRFFHVSRNSGSEELGDKVIRVTHWQLEPGFREALQWVIDEYNALPKVREAGITVMQAPISERVYNQFMNVHLISGTAPDIAVKKESNLVKGNALAKFYAPLGSYVGDPNPYNAPQYQVEDLPEDLAEYLRESPWRDTFFDGLEGGYEEELSDFFAIPICTWGGFRLIYNLSVLESAKAFALEASQQSPQPDWLRAVWLTPSNPNGYLPEAAGVEWLREGHLPRTLGQLLLYCNAIEPYRASAGIDYLVPIAGSSYVANDVTELYREEFLSAYWKELSLELGKKLSPTSIEALAGFDRGVWSFESPGLVEYFDFIKIIAGFYPEGYLGLDREQAQRRFVLGQAAILSTGGWDATSIYQGIESRDDPSDRFEIEVAVEPLPGAGERWADLLTMRASEADTKGGVPFAVNKQSPNFDWAIDFLRFASSHRINEGFAERAGWLPVITGAKAPEAVAAFMPIPEGLPKSFSLSVMSTTIPSSIRNAWSTNVKLYKTGDIGYEDMASRIVETFESPKIGIERAWVTFLQKAQDSSRANQRSISVERMSALLGSEDAAAREKANIYLNLIEDEGVHLKRWWHELNPGEPYPKF